MTQMYLINVEPIEPSGVVLSIAELPGLVILGQTADAALGWAPRSHRLSAPRRARHRSTRAIEDAIRLYLAAHNADPKPFVWVKTADEILATSARFAVRTSGK